MPFTDFIPLIGTAVQGITNAINQGSVNREQKRQRYEDRQWAIEDRDYMNAYNAPAAQMQRLKEAGLNPHLVYGSGGATVQSAPTRETSRSQQQPVQFNLVNDMVQGFLSMVDMQKKRAETDRIEAQTKQALAQMELMNKQGYFIEANTGLAKIRTDFMKFDLDKQKTLAPYQYEYAASRNQSLQRAMLLQDLAAKQAGATYEKTLADTAYTKQRKSIAIDENNRQWQANTRAWQENNRQNQELALKVKMGEMSIQEAKVRYIRNALLITNDSYQRQILQHELKKAEALAKTATHEANQAEFRDTPVWRIADELRKFIPFSRSR